jgi:DNA replication licensing factor MCM6
MVREAYSLLRQSIIHVELDDIEIDDVVGNEGDQQEREALANEEEQPPIAIQEGPMSPTRAGGSGEQLAATPQPQPQRKKIKITHDKYMEMQSLLVLHLTEVERSTGAGLEREGLIDWYLEQKEEDMNSLEELDAEKDLVGKVLKKLVKVPN